VAECLLLGVKRTFTLRWAIGRTKKKRRIISLLRRQISTEDRNWFFL